MDQIPDTDTELIAQLKDSANAAAWSEFVALYQPLILRFSHQRGMQDADAHDVCQRVLMSVARAISSWEPKPGQPFRAWLGTIARNATLNAIVRRKSFRVGTGSSQVLELLESVPEHEVMQESRDLRLEMQRELFRRAIQVVRSEFTPKTWSMFWETEMAGQTVDSVAQKLGSSAGAIYIARCRIMKRLREVVQGESQTWGCDAPACREERSE